MTAAQHAALWWDTLDPHTAAVLDIAAIDDPTARDRIAALAAPGYEPEITAINRDLGWIDKFGWDTPAIVLGEYHGREVYGSGLIEAAEALADELRADVTVRAQLVASLSVRPAVTE